MIDRVLLYIGANISCDVRACSSSRSVRSRKDASNLARFICMRVSDTFLPCLNY